MKIGVKKIAIKVMGFIFPKRNRIYLESKPPFSDNTYCVYLEMLKRGLNNKYKLIWIYDKYDVYNHSLIPEKLPYNVKIIFINNRKGIVARIKRFYHMFSGRVYLMANTVYFGYRSNQINIYLSHGAPLKKASDEKYEIDNERCTYGIALSEKMLSVTSADYRLPIERLIPTGFPRNDYFQQGDNARLIRRLNLQSYNKIIVWMPTIRKRWNDFKGETNCEYIFGLPLIRDYQDLVELNCHLKVTNSVMVIKMHFAQDNKTFFRHNLSNILFITNEDLCRLDTQLNELLAASDGLITDYSSVYFDYLLRKKPIGLIIDDIEQFLVHPGIIYKNYYDVIKGIYIRSMRDLFQYIDVTVKKSDIRSLDNVAELYHSYFDGKSSKRVVDFLMQELDD